MSSPAMPSGGPVKAFGQLWVDALGTVMSLPQQCFPPRKAGLRVCPPPFPKTCSLRSRLRVQLAEK